MASIVHLQTVVRSVFGVVDDEGNVVQEVVVSGAENQPIVLKVLNEANWTQVYNSLVDAKAQLVDRVNNPNPEAPTLAPEEEVPVIHGELVD